MVAYARSRGVWRVDIPAFRAPSLQALTKELVFHSQVISQALVSATNCVHPGLALHVSDSLYIQYEYSSTHRRLTEQSLHVYLPPILPSPSPFSEAACTISVISSQADLRPHQLFTASSDYARESPIALAL